MATKPWPTETPPQKRGQFAKYINDQHSRARVNLAFKGQKDTKATNLGT